MQWRSMPSVPGTVPAAKRRSKHEWRTCSHQGQMVRWTIWCGGQWRESMHDTCMMHAQKFPCNVRSSTKDQLLRRRHLLYLIQTYIRNWKYIRVVFDVGMHGNNVSMRIKKDLRLYKYKGQPPLKHLQSRENKYIIVLFICFLLFLPLGR
jgi:hypothetical protein